MIVEQSRQFRVVEMVLRHDIGASRERVSKFEKDQLVFSFGLSERGITEWEPIYVLSGSLLYIAPVLLSQAIRLVFREVAR